MFVSIILDYESHISITFHTKYAFSTMGSSKAPTLPSFSCQVVITVNTQRDTANYKLAFFAKFRYRPDGRAPPQAIFFSTVPAKGSPRVPIMKRFTEHYRLLRGRMRRSFVSLSSGVRSSHALSCGRSAAWKNSNKNAMATSGMPRSCCETLFWLEPITVAKETRACSKKVMKLFFSHSPLCSHLTLVSFVCFFGLILGTRVVVDVSVSRACSHPFIIIIRIKVR